MSKSPSLLFSEKNEEVLRKDPKKIFFVYRRQASLN
jgi:hypothetical protein